jgi:hypothetical protein
MIEERLYELMEEKLEFLKLYEAGKFKVVTRVRKGKIQRRKKIPAKGFTIRPDGKIVKMSPSEHLKNVRRARKGKAKRRAKRARSIMNRKKSLRKRKSIGA